MKYLFYAVTLLLFSGCATKVIPLKGHYVDKPYEIISDKTKDQVWDKIIDFFAQNGLSIKIIDKSSGLITSDKTRLSWTMENKDGTLFKPDRWIVIEKISLLGSGAFVTPTSVTGDWNIRIKDAGDNKTIINVNLVNIQAKATYSNGREILQEIEIKALSTGIFEKTIADAVK